MKSNSSPYRRFVKTIADGFMDNASEPQIVIGPVLWQPSDGTVSRRWYLMIASSEKGRGFQLGEIAVPDSEIGNIFRSTLFTAPVHRGPTIVHDCDDELHMARLCETLWPSERTRRLRANVEAKRLARAAA